MVIENARGTVVLCLLLLQSCKGVMFSLAGVM